MRGLPRLQRGLQRGPRHPPRRAPLPRGNRVFEGTYPDVRKTAYPMLCMHCETAPCVEVCPQDATYKREDGIVVIDKDKCIGCGSCQTVCPYDARHLAASEDGYFGSELSEYEAVMYETMPPMTMDKCTFCAERIDAGKGDLPGLRGRLPGRGATVRRPRGHQGPSRGCRWLPAQGRGGHEPVCVVPAPQGERVTFPPGRLPSTAGGPPPRRPRNSSSAGGVPPFAAALCGPPLCVSARGNAVRLATV